MKPRNLVLCILVATLASCAPLGEGRTATPARPTATSTPTVSMLDAINLALETEAVYRRAADVHGMAVAPRIAAVTLKRRAEAYRNEEVEDPDGPVWEVQMEGAWVVPPPVPEAETVVRHITVLVDATTGKVEGWVTVP